ncbi:Uncharacterised protein [Mycoplasmopsis citelli]|uniref:Uncharacterized protein n=2 Tax=Mycoplasmopsis citelli TaxID=171281 RepID=A0A449B253_9BACT|nr:Uncharacterised protein [Mycoplasmopsis citelli]
MKKLFVLKLSSVPGIVNIQANQESQTSEIQNESLDPMDWVEVFLTPNGWSFVASIKVLNAISVKPLMEELYSQINYELEKQKEKISNITIFIRGVKNV